MTYAQIEAEVRSNLRRSSEGSLASARILIWTNWTLNLIADLHTFEEMRQKVNGTCTIDTKSYKFPTLMKDIHSMSLIDGVSSRKLTYIPARSFDKVVPYPESKSTGRSTYYVDYGTWFELYKIPNKAYSLELRASFYPTPLTAASTTTLVGLLNVDFSRVCDKLVCYGATAEGFSSIKEPDEAKSWWIKFRGGFDAAVLTDHSGEDWTPIARPYSPGGGITGDYWKNPLIRSMDG